MTRSIWQGIATWSAVAITAAAAAPSSAQTPEETIISAEVISDVAVGTPVETEAVSEAVSWEWAGGECAGRNCGGSAGRRYTQPDLFYNYHTQGYANRTNAQMYLAPRPVPPNVGHTFYTYQPLYPHQYLYWHKDRYHDYYDDGRGLNRTRATYYSPPLRQAVSNIYWNYLRLPR